MNDQAEKLRNRLKMDTPAKEAKTLAVVSGKGGVGKSNFSLNFSISLAKKGFKVLLFDLDIGMGNIEILMGKNSSLSIADFLSGKSSMEEVIFQGPHGVEYISGGTGLSQLVRMDRDSVEYFTSSLSEVLRKYDYLIFDMGAGLNEETLSILLSVNEIFVITTTEPTSLMDAYATMKYIHLADSELPFYLVVNRAGSAKEGNDTMARLEDVLVKFLGRTPTKLGILPDDKTVQEAVKRQIPFTMFNERSQASKGMAAIIEKYINKESYNAEKRDNRSFTARLKQFLFER
ncbi:MinD/ParA family protein [Mesobacillus selenatarsenatis]|uniref:Flagellar synthesis regulator FleN n=1 Tax=Mesobacillus selenatarsenatis (strain DSM 18680 / JCM 14380 / FERM P-15431 / SF-1) TaxID=1321606 RepID=A0A0A8X981_MESS1|nr:MinD/ParA family protein [Mesobacillus selenatarsenatis]GAM15587.1 flagellar synthesis regulator FleN [Mesobacillus selenatarsenatis SF-1]